MCRFLAYLGPPITLQALLFEPEHSLLRQSWAPREQRHGRVNADGFGAGWYDRSRRPEPARYRSVRPMWTDSSFASLAGLVSSTAVLAAVRDATPPAPVEESGTPPFTEGPWLFAHNGEVRGFATEGRLALNRLLSERRLCRLQGSSDSEVLFALTLDRLDRGSPPGEALCRVVSTVTEVCGGRLNLLLADGQRIAATAYGDSLYVLEGGTLGPGAVVVASEPFDDQPGWQLVPDASLVEADPDGADIRSL